MDLEQQIEMYEQQAGSRLGVRLAKAVKGLKSAKGVANAVFAELVKEVAESGLKPEIECFLHDPVKSERHIDSKCWHVCWESGPYEWALDASTLINEQLRKNGCDFYFECYWSFSLALYPN